MQMVIALAGLAAMCGSAACAQTDVAASLYGAFTGTITATPYPGIGTFQSPSNAAGGLLEVRHISKPWIGYEGTYAFNRANQVYSQTNTPPPGEPPCFFPCAAGESVFTTPVSNNAHEVTGDWVVSVKVSNFRPFALAGGGVLFDVPSSGQVATSVMQCVIQVTTSCVLSTSGNRANTSTKPVFVYGAGVDWKLLPHIGMRLQYRGNLYKAPDLVAGFPPMEAFAHTAEPMIGVYFRL